MKKRMLKKFSSIDNDFESSGKDAADKSSSQERKTNKTTAEIIKKHNESTQKASSPEQNTSQMTKERCFCVVQPSLTANDQTGTPQPVVANSPRQDFNLINYGFSCLDPPDGPNICTADLLQLIKFTCPDLKNPANLKTRPEPCLNSHPTNYEINIEVRQKENSTDDVTRMCKMNISVSNDKSKTETPAANTEIQSSNNLLASKTANDRSEIDGKQNIVQARLIPTELRTAQQPDITMCKNENFDNGQERYTSKSRITTEDELKGNENELQQENSKKDIIDKSKPSHLYESITAVAEIKGKSHLSMKNEQSEERSKPFILNTKPEVTTEKINKYQAPLVNLTNETHEELKSRNTIKPLCKKYCSEAKQTYEHYNPKYDKTFKREEIKDQQQSASNETSKMFDRKPITICKKYLIGQCGRGRGCIFDHYIDAEQVLLAACRDFMKYRCFRDDCHFVHITNSEKEYMCRTGQLPPHIQSRVQMAQINLMNKLQGLLTDVQTRIRNIHGNSQRRDCPINSTFSEAQYKKMQETCSSCSSVHYNGLERKNYLRKRPFNNLPSYIKKPPAAQFTSIKNPNDGRSLNSDHKTQKFDIKDIPKAYKSEEKEINNNTYINKKESTNNEVFKISEAQMSDEELEVLIKEIIQEYRNPENYVKPEVVSSPESNVLDEKIEAVIREMVAEFKELQNVIKNKSIEKSEPISDGDSKPVIGDIVKEQQKEPENILPDKSGKKYIENKEVPVIGNEVLRKLESLSDEKLELAIKKVMNENETQQTDNQNELFGSSEPYKSLEKPKENHGSTKRKIEKIGVNTCNEANPNKRRKICLDYLRGICLNGVTCEDKHDIDISRLKSVFCPNLTNDRCNCRNVHITLPEKKYIHQSGKLPPHCETQMRQIKSQLSFIPTTEENQQTQRDESAQGRHILPNICAPHRMIQPRPFLPTSGTPQFSPAMLTYPSPRSYQRTLDINATPLVLPLSIPLSIPPPLLSTYTATPQYTPANNQSVPQHMLPVTVHPSLSRPSHTTTSTITNSTQSVSFETSQIGQNTAQITQYNVQNSKQNAASNAPEIIPQIVISGPQTSTVQQQTSTQCRTPAIMPYSAQIMTHLLLPPPPPPALPPPPPPPLELPRLSPLPPMVSPLQDLSDYESDSEEEPPSKISRQVDVILAVVRRSYESSLRKHPGKENLDTDESE